VVDGCRFGYFSDLHPSMLVEYLGNLRRSRDMGLDRRKQWFTVNELAVLCGISPGSVCRLVNRGSLSGDGHGKNLRCSRDTVASLLERRSRGIGVETSNHYLAAFKAFTKWLYKDHRTPHDPMVHLSRMNAEVDVRHERRPLTITELGRFLE